MNITSRQTLGATTLIIASIAAFVAPLLLHSPPIQGGPETGDGNNDGGSNPEESKGPSDGNTGSPGQPGPPPDNPGHGRKSLQDLMDGIMSCETTNHGQKMSLYVKVRSAMRADTSTRTDHHLDVLEHRLETPAAQKHAGACVNQLKSIVDELLAP